MSFTYVDLFAGIGGFHAALSAAGGDCVFASEIDPAAVAVYQRNWGRDIRPRPGRPLVEGDIVPLTERSVRHVPEHDVLAAGFPCQPFSKSGFQRGIDETRGTLFFNIARILHARRPSVILLENVRNLAGPRHAGTWATIVRTLRELGYRVSSTPCVFSPHLLPPSLGGTPQVRDRVFITGTYVGRARALRETDVQPPVQHAPIGDWSPYSWDIHDILDAPDATVDERYGLSPTERLWIDVWDDFVQRVVEVREGVRLPGFPLWADAFTARPHIPRGTPAWKADFLRKNSQFYVEHHVVIDAWLADHPEFARFPASRRKLEWQAQDAASLWDTVLHFRPSGLRAKAPTYVPALVAITQTSVVGTQGRRLTPREAARLQGLPDDFDFLGQPDATTYKQLGNGVAVGAAYHVFREHVLADTDVPVHVRTAVDAAGAVPVVRCAPPLDESRTA